MQFWQTMEKMIKAVIIDDDAGCVYSLTTLLQKNCPNVEVAGSANSVQSGTEIILSLQPDLVFLDVNLTDGDGFEILSRLKGRGFRVIFVTAHDRYAIKAFEFAALHYLLKPVNADELVRSVSRYEEISKDLHFDTKVSLLSENLYTKPHRIMLPTSDGITIVETCDIVRCEASGNYTRFMLSDGKKFLISKSINTYEHLLSDLGFFRIHRQHLVNMDFVSKYIKGRGGQIVLKNNEVVDVSENKRKEFIDVLKLYANQA